MEQTDLWLTIEDPLHTDARALVRHLSSELAARYGDDGSGAFAPAEVQVPGAAFVVARMGECPVGCGAIKPFSDARAFVEWGVLAGTPSKRGVYASKKLLYT